MPATTVGTYAVVEPAKAHLPGKGASCPPHGEGGCPFEPAGSGELTPWREVSGFPRSPAIRTRRDPAHVPELMAAVDASAPDCVITDIRMPPTHTVEGLDAVKRLRAIRPSLGVVVLSRTVATPRTPSGSSVTG